MGKENIDREEIRRYLIKRLSFLRDRVMGVLLYGSIVKGEADERSDIDVCVVAPGEDSVKLLKEIDRRVESSEFDIKIFELMPLFLKGEVIDNHEILFSRDEPELYEYLYFYRKLWEEQKHRHRLSEEDALAMFE